MIKRCLLCGEEFSGRSDKKFCSDLCRNEYHNNLRREEYKKMTRCNMLLRQNRNILLSYSSSGVTEIDKASLALDNFCFDVFTSARYRRWRPTLYFCYEFEYFITRRGTVRIRGI